MRKWIWITGSILFLFVLLFLFRYSILRGIGGYLIVSEAAEKSEVMFVLSGSPVDRGTEAVKIYSESFAKKIICTGGNKPADFEALGLDYYESQLTKSEIVRSGVPDSVVLVINKGTSTNEESDVALAYCKQNNIHSCIVLSSAFHTRRVRNVFKKKLEKENIKVIICSAPARTYNESSWWESEYGMIAVNNEYVKLMYYCLK